MYKYISADVQRPRIQVSFSSGSFLHDYTCSLYCTIANIKLTVSAVHCVEPTSRYDTFLLYTVRRDICFDINDPAQFLFLQCPLVGVPPSSSNTITRTWSKITDDGENVVLFSLLDSDPPSRRDALDFYARFPGSSTLLSFGFELFIPPTTHHDLVFFTNPPEERDIEGLSRVFGTWNCTVSNSFGSDSVLTTILLSDCCEWMHSRITYIMYNVYILLSTCYIVCCQAT